MFTEQSGMFTEYPCVFTVQPAMFTEQSGMFMEQPYLNNVVSKMQIDNRSKLNSHVVWMYETFKTIFNFIVFKYIYIKNGLKCSKLKNIVLLDNC